MQNELKQNLKSIQITVSFKKKFTKGNARYLDPPTESNVFKGGGVQIFWKMKNKKKLQNILRNGELENKNTTI